MAIYNPEYAHWHQFFEGLSVSPTDFYHSLARGIEETKLPEAQAGEIEFLERGLFSSKRLYLQIRRDWMTYHLCAAPFGTGFFVSSRLLTTTWNSWPVLLIPLCLCPLIPILTYTVVYTLSKSVLSAGLFALALVPISIAIVIASFVVWYMRHRLTYYRLDTMTAFQEAVHRLLIKQVNKTVESAGRKPLSAEESKPVLHRLLQR